MKLALYVRVSSSDRNSELKIRELRIYAEHQGWEIAQEYADTISGAKASRPALTNLMADARAGKFDCLLVWKLDRFGRSLVDCLNSILCWRSARSGLLWRLSQLTPASRILPPAF